jgi:RNA 3'-terminal phosphate cyclase (ATP)
LTLLGGTNATNAPQIDYTQNVFMPFMKRHFGVDGISIDVQRRGYFPKGGGRVVCKIPSFTGPLPALNIMDQGDVIAVHGIAHLAGLPGHLGKSMVEGAADVLKSYGIPANQIKIKHVREKNDNTVGGGAGIVIWAETSTGCVLGGSAVGRKGSSATEVGRDAAEELVRALKSGGCVDEWMQDQIILFVALAQGRSSVRMGQGELTLHTRYGVFLEFLIYLILPLRTAIWIVEQLTEARFEIEEDASGQRIVHCTGIGYKQEFVESIK